jgi:peptidoglycan/xylan/chitin deacetylase (PgdA/CDA1 family)
VVFRSLFRVLAPGGGSARLPVLIFHRVLPEPDAIFPDEMHARRFDELCGWLKAWFHVLPLDCAVAMLKSGSLPARAACITFDDGYADNFDVAMPILRAHGLPATFFIATGFLDGGRMWNDTVIESIRSANATKLDLGRFGCFPVSSSIEKRVAIDAVIRQIKYLPMAERLAVASEIVIETHAQPPNNLMMTAEQVRVMRQSGMQIGAHTVSHPILSLLDEPQAKAEIKGSKDFLEGILGERIGLFAYPNGKPAEDYDDRTVDIVRGLDFDAAVCTQWGASRSGDDIFQIRRFTPWDRAKYFFGVRMLRNLAGA